jgi:DNA-binding response OmpR family regulator
MSGLDLLEELRRRGDPIPAIVITGGPSAATESRALAAGADAVAPKPFDGEELLGLIRRSLNGKACSRVR